MTPRINDYNSTEVQVIENPKLPHEKFILVLDLDETLVHFKETMKYNVSDTEKLKIRPGVS